MAFGLGAIIGGASLASSLLGGRKKGSGMPESSSSVSGYNALPAAGRQVYDNYFKMLNNVAANPYDQNRLGMVGVPQSIFDSPELYALQQTQPEQGARPIGVLEPLNEIQRNALGSYATPDFSDAALASYMKPFEGIRNRTLENINRNSNIAFSGIKGREARVGSLARSPLYGDQLPQLEEARARALADAEAQFTMNALGLRKESLADMLNAGNLVQKQNQAGLQAASGQGLTMANPAFGQASALMQLLAGMPNSGSGQSMGAIAARDNNLTKLGNLGTSLFGNQFTGLFG
jgi:hypothetical protein